MEVDCEFKNMKWELTGPAVYSCLVTFCDITSRDSQIIAFKGVHDASKDNKDVIGLSFKKTTVHYFPRNLSTIFPNLVYLHIGDCGLKELLRKDLVGLGNLETFSIQNNEIKTLPVDLFQNMKKLKLVGLGYNKIEGFNTKILDPIKSTIEYFVLGGNPGSSESFSKSYGTIGNFVERLKNLEHKRMNTERLENLFTTSKHSDFTIEVQDKKYKVHKGVLASMSSVFDEMFSADPGLTSKSYENIRNFSDGAIKEFLSYFYTRVTPSEENASVLLELAVEFDFTDLKLQCEDVLMTKITPENAQHFYNLALRHSLPYLKKKAFEALRKIHQEIADIFCDELELVNKIIAVKDKHQAKKIKLEEKD